MNKTLDDWMLECEQRLCLQPKAIREAIAPVFFRFHAQAPALLGASRLNAKNAISKRVKPLSLLAQTQAELTVTASAFELIYDYHQALNPELIVPSSILPLQPERPMIDDATPALGIIESLRRGLYAACPYVKGTQNETDERYQAAIGQSILLVGFRAGLTRMSELIALLNLSQRDWVSLSCDWAEPERGLLDATCETELNAGNEIWLSAYLPTLHRRVYLRQEAVLAMYQVQAHVQAWPARQRKKRLQRAILAWRDHWGAQVHVHQREAITALTAAELLRYCGHLDNSVGISHLWPQNSALDHPSFLRSFMGKRIRADMPESARRRTVKNAASIEWQEPEQYTGKVRETKAISRYLRQVLSDYQQEDPRQRRAGTAYQHAKHALESLLQAPMPWTAALSTQWIVSLFFYGSAWKERLAVGTLLTYHSTMQRFVAQAWQGIDILALSDGEFEARCQAGLEQFDNAEEQYTVARFLRFCQQYSRFPAIDLDIFDVVSSQGRVRAHYVPPCMFDAICQQFGEQGGAFERKIIVFMQLCYYAGLREDEALSLKLRDIDVNTGFLYITKEKKRKTTHAARKIPLALVPTHIITQWLAYMDEQHALHSELAYEHRPLFSHWAFSPLEEQFIDFARAYLQDDSIVTHSFRHCAANNWVCLLAMLAFDGQSWPSVYFMRHALFSNAQLDALRAMFDGHGQRVTPYFFILDWVAEKLGHASPATAWATYWHWVDWVSLVATYHPLEVHKSQLRFWTSDSNYGFERQKQLFQTPNDRSQVGRLVPSALRQWVIRQWKDAEHYNVGPPNFEASSLNTGEFASELESGVASRRFSHFASGLERLLKGGDDALCSPELVQWLAHSNRAPQCPNIEPHQQHAWLRVCLHIDTWCDYPIKKLRRMHAHLKKGQTLLSGKHLSRYRDLQCLLFVYRYLNVQPLTIKVQARPDSSSAAHWQRLIERSGALCMREVSVSKTRAAVRPYRLQWTLWPDVGAIVALLVDYLDWFLWVTEESGAMVNNPSEGLIGMEGQ